MQIAQLLFEDEAAELVGDLIADVKDGVDLDDASLDRLLRSIERHTAGWVDRLAEDGAEDLPKVPRLFPQIVEEARDLLRHGLRDEALNRLEKVARPKWDSEDASRAAYIRQMKAQRLHPPQVVSLRFAPFKSGDAP